MFSYHYGRDNGYIIRTMFKIISKIQNILDRTNLDFFEMTVYVT